MLEDRRINILCGHYGSGKTNIAVNLALRIKKNKENVALADLDIVNPYFRAEDSRHLMEENGIRMICSDYANSNVDIPALPQEIYAITDDKSLNTVIDVGGDDRGAYALGRLSPSILADKDYNMLMVINKFRPLTPTPEDTIEVMREIETACGIPFTGIINNSNLGAITTEGDVIKSVDYAVQTAKMANLPLVFTSVNEGIYDKLEGKIDSLFKLKLQKKITDSNY